MANEYDVDDEPDDYTDDGEGRVEAVDEARELAEHHGFLRTGGSDCHGEGSGKYRFGVYGVGEGDYERLRDSA